MSVETVNRRPNLSKFVVVGLENLLRRTEARDEDEASAKLWIARMIEWRRLQSRQPDPQDADLCLPGESREPPHGGSRGSGDETRETT
jgi:hypothetical protein